MSSSTPASSGGTLMLCVPGASVAELRNRQRAGWLSKWVGGRFEPSGDLGQVERLELVRIETRQTYAPGPRDTRCRRMRGNEKRPAVGFQGEARLVGLLLKTKRNQIGDGAFLAVMSPDQTLAGKRLEGGSVFQYHGTGPMVRSSCWRRVVKFGVGMREARLTSFAGSTRELSGLVEGVSLHIGADEFYDVVHLAVPG